MPASMYEELLCQAQPKVIETTRHYDQVVLHLGQPVRKGGRRNADETRLMKLLAVLVEDYDRRHALPPQENTPAQSLRYLLEVSGKTAADLIPVFGQRSHVSEALRGKRAISLAQARKLGALFRVRSGLFV
jgi:HTH-type transcriptional regulator/antitoxin HigA